MAKPRSGERPLLSRPPQQSPQDDTMEYEKILKTRFAAILMLSFTLASLGILQAIQMV